MGLPLSHPLKIHANHKTKDIEMITKYTKILALAILFATSAVYAELYNPFSTCNVKQAQIMTNKCEKLSGKAYTECERQTLQEFFTCVSGEKGGKR